MASADLIAVQVSGDRRSATITLGHAQLEQATLDVHESHVYAQQQSLFTRINEFLNGNPNSQQALQGRGRHRLIGGSSGRRV